MVNFKSLISRSIYPVLAVFMYLFGVASTSFAAVGVVAPTDTSLGEVGTLNELFYWIINVMKYLGWAGVLIGVFIVLALLVYKLIGGDDTETMKKVQDGITKAVIIVLIGILLIGGSFLISQIADLIGADAPLDLGELNT